MWKGRRLFFYSLAFIAGDLFGGWLTLPPALFFAAAIVCATIALIDQNLSLIHILIKGKPKCSVTSAEL